MRLLPVAALPAALLMSVLPGCASKWQLNGVDPIPACINHNFYMDADGDGWGDPAIPAQVQCEGNSTTGFTVRNDRDCDDSDKTITGQIGSICPNDLVIGGTTFVSATFGTNEYAIVTPGSATKVWAQYAEGACGPSGWGGGLAVLTDQGGADLSSLVGALSSESSYAGFVGIEPDGSGSWKWESDSSVDISTLNLCSSLPDSSAMSAEARLALVKPEGGDWCLGTADEAGGDYAADSAYFVCERAVPDASKYVDHATPASAS